MSDNTPPRCRRCDGCGQIADTEEGEPWTSWTALPAHSAIAVFLGLVKPKQCPDCGGTGKGAPTPPRCPGCGEDARNSPRLEQIIVDEAKRWWHIRCVRRVLVEARPVEGE